MSANLSSTIMLSVLGLSVSSLLSVKNLEGTNISVIPTGIDNPIST
jgi:hypothetical protein